MPKSTPSYKNIYIIFVAVFFFFLHLSLTAYVNSSLIQSFGVSNTGISFIYSLASIFTIIGLLSATKITEYIGNRKLMIILLVTTAFAAMGIVTTTSLLLFVPIMILFLFFRSLITFEMDVFAEHFSDVKHIGHIRGLWVVILSITWGVGPIIAGYMVDHYSLTSVYVLSIATIIIPLVIFFLNFSTEHFKKRKRHNLVQIFKILNKKTDLRNIFLVSLGLHVFYAIAVIYVPLHLFQNIGFTWSQIGMLILLANIPFLILSYPIGQVADRYTGEQEFIITGLVIGAISTLGFVFIQEPHFMAWAIVFMVSRMGMSMLETGSETYFFKKIRHDDTEKIGIQRNAMPIAYLIISLVGIIIGTLTSSYLPIFIIGGLVLLITIYPARLLHDTK